MSMWEFLTAWQQPVVCDCNLLFVLLETDCRSMLLGQADNSLLALHTSMFMLLLELVLNRRVHM